MNKSKIAFFLPTFVMGGVERITADLGNELVKRGYDITFIIMDDKKPCYHVDEKIKIYNLNQDLLDIVTQNKFKRTMAYLLLMMKLMVFIKKNKIDILINAGLSVPFISIPLKRLINTKIISCDHVMYGAHKDTHFYVRSTELSKKQADALVVLTQENVALYKQSGDCAAPVTVINNFFGNEYPKITSSLETKNVLLLGRFAKEKNIPSAIRVWEIVKQDPRSAEWTLTLKGEGPKEDIKVMVEEKKLTDSVKILEAGSNVEQDFLNSSIYIMTSSYEGFGMVLMEAQCYGLPVVAFDCMMGPREIVTDGVDGFIIPFTERRTESYPTENDEKKMAEKILLLMSDEKLRKEMGRKARESSKRFLKDKIIDQWEMLFAEVLNKNK